MDPVDFAAVGMDVLAPQLRKPEGELGVQVGEMMAGMTGPLNMFAVDLLGVQPRDHILEIGFGPGETIAELVRLAPDGWIAGIDHSQEMLDMAESRNHRVVMQEHVELTLGTAAELPYPDDGFDKVLAVNVMHFWKEPLTELRECLRVLKPGGKAVFCVRHPDDWRLGQKESGVFFAHQPQEAEALLREAGFREVTSQIRTFEDGRAYAVTGVK